ncbi:ABC transporter ATP-binding protein [Yunchengibacter salinarum]|uniref:ABC transporter ATP-binding protein n=1 Tax=Yunchengibacter salinarum TaxID=3133399 RepID=UPI0035B649E4
MIEADRQNAAETPDPIVVRARGLGKHYGETTALEGVDLDIPLGRIVGVIGANGAGKTTMLQSILGLQDFEGELSVLGRDPGRRRHDLMTDVCFIADVATLPKWMTVRQVLDYVADVHPRFDRDKARTYLARTKIPLDRKVKALSKGMVVQVHLAVVMAIDARLLVLDEPTLGLDIVFRKQFYRNLLEEYFDEDRTILITTHQVEEVEHILSDVIFIHDGRKVLDQDMESLSERFAEVAVTPDREAEARALGPVQERSSFGRTVMTFENADPDALEPLGTVRGLSLADIFVTTVSDPSVRVTAQGDAQ